MASNFVLNNISRMNSKTSIIEIFNCIDQINDGEVLKKLKEEIDSNLNKLEKKEFIAHVQHQIETTGYFITSNDSLEIDGCKSERVNFYVNLRAYDRDEQSDARICGIAHKQDNWVKKLNYKYNEKTDFNYKHLKEYDTVSEWEADDWDDPCRAIGKARIYIYYKPGRILIPDDTNCRVTAFDFEFDEEHVLKKSKINNKYFVDLKNDFIYRKRDIDNWYIMKLEPIDEDDSRVNSIVQEHDTIIKDTIRTISEKEYDSNDSNDDDDDDDV